ncbi:hypothetical protein SDC9_142198 [bioreactor metagenome]|uniref:Uncharacterized protein n=1 Tax=bioreactor metagenome TaxID=1076179 RepID=A0A645E074_9ZZZZ
MRTIRHHNVDRLFGVLLREIQRPAIDHTTAVWQRNDQRIFAVRHQLKPVSAVCAGRLRVLATGHGGAAIRPGITGIHQFYLCVFNQFSFIEDSAFNGVHPHHFQACHAGDCL